MITVAESAGNEAGPGAQALQLDVDDPLCAAESGRSRRIRRQLTELLRVGDLPVEIQPILLLSAALPHPLDLPNPGLLRIADFDDVVDGVSVHPTDAVARGRRGIERVSEGATGRDTSAGLVRTETPTRTYRLRLWVRAIGRWWW